MAYFDGICCPISQWSRIVEYILESILEKEEQATGITLFVGGIKSIEFLDVVQGRLVKLWFGVSKFASNSSLVYAVEWEKASDLVRTSHETCTALGPVSMSNYTMSCRPNFPTGIMRRNIGLWLSKWTT